MQANEVVDDGSIFFPKKQLDRDLSVKFRKENEGVAISVFYKKTKQVWRSATSPHSQEQITANSS